jgi:hypothetical protein
MDDSIPQPDAIPPGNLPVSESTPAPLLDYATPGAKPTMVRLRRFNSSTDAQLANLKLQAHGIRTQLAGEARLAGLGAYGAVSGELELLVQQEDLDAANAILQDVENRRSRRLAAVAERMKCPACGQNDSRGYDTRRMTVGVLLIVGSGALLFLGVMQLLGLIAGIIAVYIMISAATHRRTCRRCGTRWLLESEEPDDEDDEDKAPGEDKNDPPPNDDAAQAR